MASGASEARHEPSPSPHFRSSSVCCSRSSCCRAARRPSSPAASCCSDLLLRSSSSGSIGGDRSAAASASSPSSAAAVLVRGAAGARAGRADAAGRCCCRPSPSSRHLFFRGPAASGEASLSPFALASRSGGRRGGRARRRRRVSSFRGRRLGSADGERSSCCPSFLPSEELCLRFGLRLGSARRAGRCRGCCDGGGRLALLLGCGGGAAVV